MTYELTPFKDIEKNYIFWLKLFFGNKLTTLSNRYVIDRSKFALCIENLKEVNNLAELTNILKQIRSIGLIGINTYTIPLLKFAEYLKNKNLSDFRDIDEMFLSEFIAVYTANLSNATKRNYRIVLIGFFGFIDKHNKSDKTYESYIFNIELKNLSGTRGASGQKLPTFLKKEELELFLTSIDTTPMKPSMQARDRLIVKFIVYTGIRVSEAIHLRAKDIIKEKDVYMLNIRGKGDKQRVVMIKRSNVDYLIDEWLIMRSKIPNIQDGLFFCNKSGKALTQSHIYGVVKSILGNIGITKEKMGAHMLRHSFATLLYQKHKDLVLVQEVLGHANLNTSRIYTHFDTDKLRAAAHLMDDMSE